MTNPNLTLIVVVLDRSGSMATMREATVAGLNQFFRAQRELPGEAVLHLVQFDDQYEVHQDWTNLKDFKDMTQDDFVPRGWTALYDAIGRTVDGLGARLAKLPEYERPGKVVVVVQTDGAENSSKEYTSAKVKDMLTHQREKYGWDFVFLGANQDAVFTGQTLGFLSGSSLTYTSSSVSNAKAYAAVSNYVGATRSCNSTTFDSYRAAVVDDTVDPDDLDITVTQNPPTSNA